MLNVVWCAKNWVAQSFNLLLESTTSPNSSCSYSMHLVGELYDEQDERVTALALWTTKCMNTCVQKFCEPSFWLCFLEHHEYYFAYCTTTSQRINAYSTPKPCRTWYQMLDPKQWSLFQDWMKYFLDNLILLIYMLRININISRGDRTDISVKILHRCKGGNASTLLLWTTWHHYSAPSLAKVLNNFLVLMFICNGDRQIFQIQLIPAQVIKGVYVLTDFEQHCWCHHHHYFVKN